MVAKLEISKWTVLIVDDSPDNVGVAETVFSHFGANVYTASDGNAGLEILQKVKPTVVLLDISMPLKNGWETLQAIRENPEWEKMIVIAVTAHAMKGDREKIMAAGFDGYIAKPFHVTELIKQVQAIVDELTVISETPDATQESLVVAQEPAGMPRNIVTVTQEPFPAPKETRV